MMNPRRVFPRASQPPSRHHATENATGARPEDPACRERDPAMADSGIRFEAVSVVYDETRVLASLDLEVEPGRIVALVGPSGSGKTTALRALAGFVKPSAGRIFIGGRDVTQLAPAERDIGMVVQNYALFPHMRVADNVAFGLRARGAHAALVRERVEQCLDRVGMARYAKRYPRELSGGQQQRVALARALAIRPRVLLLDEPLSALDAQTRRTMLDELAALHRDLPALTVLYVTHDQSEALRLADVIGIMRGGRLVACDRAQHVYRHPPNRFAAEFLGQANVFPVRALRIDRNGGATAHFDATPLQGRNPHGLPEASNGLACVRAHDLRLGAGDTHANRLRATVCGVTWLGDRHDIELDVAGHSLRLQAPPRVSPPVPGTVVTVHVDPDDVTFVPETAA